MYLLLSLHCFLVLCFNSGVKGTHLCVLMFLFSPPPRLPCSVLCPKEMALPWTIYLSSVTGWLVLVSRLEAWWKQRSGWPYSSFLLWYCICPAGVTSLLVCGASRWSLLQGPGSPWTRGTHRHLFSSLRGKGMLRRSSLGISAPLHLLPELSPL